VSAYADTGFLVSLLLVETTSQAADGVFASLDGAVLLSPLSLLELRNALNLAIVRGRITEAERDTAWRHVEEQQQAGVFQLVQPDFTLLHRKARELSDRHTPLHATRSLDLLHVAAALLLDVDEFLTFDIRQSRVAVAEGLTVRP